MKEPLTVVEPPPGGLDRLRSRIERRRMARGAMLGLALTLGSAWWLSSEYGVDRTLLGGDRPLVRLQSQPMEPSFGSALVVEGKGSRPGGRVYWLDPGR